MSDTTRPPSPAPLSHGGGCGCKIAAGVLAQLTGQSALPPQALKKNLLDDSGYRTMVQTITQSNRPGAALAQIAGVHALTDVTGFGLLGHTLELARGACRPTDIGWSASFVHARDGATDAGAVRGPGLCQRRGRRPHAGRRSTGGGRLTS